MTDKFREISECRISGDSHLIKVLSLGEQVLTGVFPRDRDQHITKGPLDLVWNPISGLLQLGHSYDLSEMYGANYGYRSGLNESMVRHLKNKVDFLVKRRPISQGDVILDIGSNDGTLLSLYTEKNLRKVGIDPTGNKFADFYGDGIDLIADFFNAETFRKLHPDRNAAIITSIAMFYDLERPAEFVKDISNILDDTGIWHFEQSYMPAMLRTGAYDTVCHEHLEYYSIGVIKSLLEANELKIIDVQLNGVNGGSCAITAARIDSKMTPNSGVIDWLLGQEERMELDTPKAYRDFESRVFRHRNDLMRLVESLTASKKTIAGYGASTKGNVLLQFCGFTETEIPCIAEINPDKFGCYTPGSLIPIQPEKDVKAMKPDYMLVLPWHFKEHIINREREYLANGGRLIFPLPEIEIV